MGRDAENAFGALERDEAEGEVREHAVVATPLSSKDRKIRTKLSTHSTDIRKQAVVDLDRSMALYEARYLKCFEHSSGLGGDSCIDGEGINLALQVETGETECSQCSKVSVDKDLCN